MTKCHLSNHLTQMGLEFVYNPAEPLDGIIAHLTRECGGNVHAKGVVKVTASGFLGDHEPENTVDLKSHSYFRSADSPNSWICYDFGGAARDPDELLDKVVPRWARWLSPQVVGPRGLKRRDRGLVVGH